MSKYGKIASSREITAEDIDNVMDAAMAGIAYWASELGVRVKPTEPGATALSEYLTKGGELTIEVPDMEDKEFRINEHTIVRGLKKYGKQDLDDFDSVDADQVVQLGIFGEVIFA